MDILWTPWQLGTLELPNRIVRSATWEGLADATGRPLPALADMLRKLSQGGSGLVVVGFSYFDPMGQALAHQCGITDKHSVADYRPLAAAIAEGGGKSCLQIAHAGLQLWPDMVEQGGEPEGPGGPGVACQQLSAARLGELAANCARAAGKAKEAGFDAVQLHVAHGYLFNAFLSPLSNRRPDEYGGTVAARARFLVETISAIRAEVGPDYPVWAKWNCADFFPGGLTLEDSLAAAELVAGGGALDALEISGGIKDSGELGCTRGGDAEEAYFRSEAASFAARLELPVGTVGGIRNVATAAELVSRGMAFVALSRPLICQPDLPAIWRAGETGEADCTSCNRCFLPARRGRGIKCMARRRS